MPFGIVGQTGPAMKQVVRFGDRSTGTDTFQILGANLGRAIVTNGDFTGSVCDGASTVGVAAWGGVCRGTRHRCMMGFTSCKRNGRFGGGFVPHFHNGKCHWVADDEMFPIRKRKLYNISRISVRQTYRWKARFVGFLAIYSVSRSKFGFMRN